MVLARVASVTVKLNIRYNVNTIQVYLSACNHSDEEIKSLYGVHLASDNEKNISQKLWIFMAIAETIRETVVERKSPVDIKKEIDSIIFK